MPNTSTLFKEAWLGNLCSHYEALLQTEGGAANSRSLSTAPAHATIRQKRPLNSIDGHLSRRITMLIKLSLMGEPSVDDIRVGRDSSVRIVRYDGRHWLVSPDGKEE